MTIIPINGKNERMGGLFKTPKHLLIVDGVPALKRTVEYMSQFGEVVILAGEQYYGDIKLEWLTEDCTVKKVLPTSNVIETIHQYIFSLDELDEELYIVDCDVVPVQLRAIWGNCVYCFENTKKINHYSNYFIKDDKIVDCNEKTYLYDHAGAGVYHFERAGDFVGYSVGAKSVCDVVLKAIRNVETFYGHTKNEITRIGTLPDITGGFTDNKLNRTITKEGRTIADEIKWYEAYEDKTDIPEVLSYSDKIMTMDFIESDSLLNVYSVHAIIEKYRYYKPLNSLTFDAYWERIYHHLVKNPIPNGGKLIEALKYTVIPLSFCHGDLSVTNILPTKKGMKLIDPLYSTDKFGSYVLDYAKLLFSLKFYSNDLGNYNLFRSLINQPKIDVLIASECIRVATYNRNFNFVAENLINEL